MVYDYVINFKAQLSPFFLNYYIRLTIRITTNKI